MTWGLFFHDISYGMTETTSGVITQKDIGGAPGSIGVLCPNHDCIIVDVVTRKGKYNLVELNVPNRRIKKKKEQWKK